MLTDAVSIACWFCALDMAVCGEVLEDIEVDFYRDGTIRGMRFEYADPFATESEDE